MSDASVDSLAVFAPPPGDAEVVAPVSRGDYDAYVLDILQWSLIGVFGTLLLCCGVAFYRTIATFLFSGARLTKGRVDTEPCDIEGGGGGGMKDVGASQRRMSVALIGGQIGEGAMVNPAHEPLPLEGGEGDVAVSKMVSDRVLVVMQGEVDECLREQGEKFEAEGKALFRMIDKDRNGKLSLLELEFELDKMGYSQDQVAEWFHHADVDNSGDISCEEFA